MASDNRPSTFRGKRLQRLTVFLLAAALASAGIARGQSAPNGPHGGAGLDSLDENNLYGELANRGLDDLLKRVLATDNVAPEQQKPVWSLAALHRLSSATHLTEEQRQAALASVLAGIDRVIDLLRGDPALLIKEARILADQGIDPQTGVLEYWGETQAEKTQLRPLAEAAMNMYDQAAQAAAALATDLANRITSPDDKLADQWRQASDIASAAVYQKARMQYSLALATDSADPRRPAIIDQALKTLAQWDNADSGIQAQARLLAAKLHVLRGDPDEIAAARKLLDSIVSNPHHEIAPPPTPELVFEARCYDVIIDLNGGDAAAAGKDLESATAYQQKQFANDPDQAAALRLLRYRLLALVADQSPPGAPKDAANAAAVEALAQLVTDFPNLRDAIFRQLAARLPANPDLDKLDPVLLLALVDEGRQAAVAAMAGQPADAARLRQALAAAQTVVARYAAGNFPAAQAVEPSLLIGIFQDSLGDKAAAVTSLLDHIARFGNDPHAHGDVALERARGLIADLRQESGNDPRVLQLEDRFLPVAINPPFNRREFALQYAADLFTMEKWADAIRYYQMVPDTEPPSRLLLARYSEMVAMKNELEATPGLSSAQRRQWTDQIDALAETVRQLATRLIANSTNNADKTRAQSTLARMSLLAADLTRREGNDPRHVLDLLSGFETSVQGLPDAKSLISGALFLRVQAYMELGQNNDATQTLVQYLNGTEANEGAQTVHDLLATLNKDLDQARAEADAAATRHDVAAERAARAGIRQLAANRAMLSGFLVKWAQGSSDAKIRGYAYIYRRFDADAKRLAAELETDPAVRKQQLAAALDLYKQLQSPENFALYQAGLEAGSADKDYPDPQVTLGIGLIAYEQGDCRTVKETLGRLIQDEKLGENNDQYWEATFKLLDCMHTLARNGDASTSDAQVRQSLQVLYLIWRDSTGGPKYHDKFEALRKEVLPNWTPPASAPGTDR